MIPGSPSPAQPVPDGFALRPLEESDYEAMSRVQGRRYPDHPVSSKEFRQWNRILDGTHIFHHWLAVEKSTNGELVGWGAVYNHPWTYDRDKYSMEVVIDPAFQGRGLGRCVYWELERVARGRKAVALWATVRANDERSVRFFSRCGFGERRRGWTSRLSLSSVPRSSPGSSGPWEGTGVIFTTIAEEGSERRDVQERLFRLQAQAGRDVPSLGRPTPPSFDQFLEATFRSPGFIPEGVFVARVGDRYVSMTTLSKLPQELDTLHVDFTGTLREFRGKGLAGEVKRRSVDFAKTRGYQYLRTENDSQNAPIWAINERLGFRTERVFIHGEKDLLA